jgi:hypothetical protein
MHVPRPAVHAGQRVFDKGPVQLFQHVVRNARPTPERERKRDAQHFARLRAQRVLLPRLSSSSRSLIIRRLKEAMAKKGCASPAASRRASPACLPSKSAACKNPLIKTGKRPICAGRRHAQTAAEAPLWGWPAACPFRSSAARRGPCTQSRYSASGATSHPSPRAHLSTAGCCASSTSRMRTAMASDARARSPFRRYLPAG